MQLQRATGPRAAASAAAAPSIFALPAMRPCAAARPPQPRAARQQGRQASARPFTGARLQAVREDQAVDTGSDASTVQAIADVSKAVDVRIAATVDTNVKAAAAAAAAPPPPSAGLRAKIDASIKQLGAGLLERDTEARPPRAATAPRRAAGADAGPRARRRVEEEGAAAGGPPPPPP